MYGQLPSACQNPNTTLRRQWNSTDTKTRLRCRPTNLAMLCAHCLSEDPRRREQIKVRLHAWPSARDLSLHGSKLQFAPDLFLSHLTSIPPGWPHLDSANQADGRTTYVCSCSPVCFPCPFVRSSLSSVFFLFPTFLGGWFSLFVPAHRS